MNLNDIEWRVSDGLTDYQSALNDMLARQAAVQAGEARELVWLLEHPPEVGGAIPTAINAMLG